MRVKITLPDCGPAGGGPRSRGLWEEGLSVVLNWDWVTVTFQQVREDPIWSFKSPPKYVRTWLKPELGSSHVSPHYCQHLSCLCCPEWGWRQPVRPPLSGHTHCALLGLPCAQRPGDSHLLFSKLYLLLRWSDGFSSRTSPNCARVPLADMWNTEMRVLFLTQRRTSFLLPKSPRKLFCRTEEFWGAWMGNQRHQVTSSSIF